MTVGELIKKLKEHNPDKLVLVSAYEEGYDSLQEVRNIKVKHKPSDKYWKGNYENYPLDECDIDAILLPR
jgi:hypothetical protein